MKDILLIGGPATLTGVDRINDDLLSILAEDNLFSRKAVIVWPTPTFLSAPDNPDSLQPHIDMNDAIWSVIEEKRLMPSSGLTLERIEELKADVQKDKPALDASIIHTAMSEAIYRLSRLILDISGGLRLAVVVGHDAPDHSLCWTRLVNSWNSSNEVDVKRYDTKSPCYGALTAVKDWGLEFGGLAPGSYKVEDLLPEGDVGVLGHTVNTDMDWNADTPHALAKDAAVEYPVETRANNAKAVQVGVGDGYMLVVPEPDKPKNFRIALIGRGSEGG